MSLNKGHAATEVRNITRSCEVSTKVGVFMSTQPIFIDLAHCPTSGSSELSHACQDTAIQTVGSAIMQPSL